MLGCSLFILFNGVHSFGVPPRVFCALSDCEMKINSFQLPFTSHLHLHSVSVLTVGLFECASNLLVGEEVHVHTRARGQHDQHTAYICIIGIVVARVCVEIGFMLSACMCLVKSARAFFAKKTPSNMKHVRAPLHDKVLLCAVVRKEDA